MMDGNMDHMVRVLIRMLAAGGGAQTIVTHSLSYMDGVLLTLIIQQLIGGNAVIILLGPEQMSTGKINMDSIILM